MTHIINVILTEAIKKKYAISEEIFLKSKLPIEIINFINIQHYLFYNSKI